MELSTDHAGQPLPSRTQLDELRTLTGSFRVSRAIYVAAELGLADFLANGSQTTTALAAAVHADEDALYRLLRLLAGAGLFEEVTPSRFTLTALGAGLRRDLPGSVRPLALNMLDEPRWQAWGQLLHTVRTRRPGFDRAHGMGLFEYLRDHPENAARFNEAMASEAARSAQALLEAYDFEGIQRLVDVGGGNGALLALILLAHPEMHGVLFDAPEVTAAATLMLAQSGIANRCELSGGDFFDAVPAGDAYVLRHILHNWDDSKATTILANCRQALMNDGKVLVVERAIGADYRQDLPNLLLDLQMLVMLGGRERSDADYCALFTAAGLQVRTIIRVGNAPQATLFEGVPT